MSKFVENLRSFWQRVSEGFEVEALWGQFQSEARASYALYEREVDWKALEHEKPLKRFFKISRALFWAMLMKLSPARRVFLLLALLFGVLALLTVSGDISKNGVVVKAPNNTTFVLLSLGGLLFLLALELADRVIMKRDLEIAREIQKWLVPGAPPAIEGAEIAFTSRPANTVGGDYYDAFLRDGGAPPGRRLMIVVADVAGKSVPAALLMATFQASLRSLAALPGSLEDLVATINRYCCAHSLGGQRFTTAFFGELDPATRALNYISAGHNPPVLRRASGRLERLEVGNLPLGIDADRQYVSGQAQLAPGDLLVVFTDGVIEAVNEREEEYGEERLLAALGSMTNPGAQAALDNLLAGVDGFVGHARQHDDITLLILRTA